MRPFYIPPCRLASYRLGIYNLGVCRLPLQTPTRKLGAVLFPSEARAIYNQLNYCVCPCVRAKRADLAHFQPVVSPGCCKPWLPDIGQIWCVPSATQAYASHACAKASACMRYLGKSWVSKWITSERCWPWLPWSAGTLRSWCICHFLDLSENERASQRISSL